jgi:transcriptional regulator with XRE-family HTH domain
LNKYIAIGQRVREVIAANKSSQAWLAKYLDISAQQMSNIVQGKHALQHKHTERICALWGVDYNWLMTGETSLPQNTNKDCMECQKKDIRIMMLEDALYRAETKIDMLNREIGSLKQKGLPIGVSNGQAKKTTNK